MALKATRRNVLMPEDLWTAAKEQARLESEQKGEWVSVSQWIRRAMRRELNALKRMEERQG